MKKEVYVVYNDNRKPDREIRNITGKKGFGETIFKRLTLRERMRQYYLTLPQVRDFVDLEDKDKIKNDSETPVILIYSDFVIGSEAEVEILVNKALYAHESYCALQKDKIAAVIFESVSSFASSCEDEYAAYEKIPVNCFVDISEVNNFRQFITSGLEARFFNSLSGDEYTLIKTSDKKEKLKAEYMMYDLLPENMKQWFVRPYDYRDQGDKASYCMQRFNMTDLAIRYIHGSIDIDEFEDILEKLFYFIKIRATKTVTKEEYEREAKKLYLDKLDDRIESLKQMEGYDRIAKLIEASTAYKDIDEIVCEYKKLYETIRAEKTFEPIKAAGHGDLCFSNILYSREVSLLKLIDPKGATNEEELYMDPFYDIAKLSHSICGNYDFYNSDLYEIGIDSDLKARLTVYADNKAYVNIFKRRLEENGYDLRLIRLYEASLFLSMLPLHMDRPKKVYAFILNAVLILDELKKD